MDHISNLLSKALKKRGLYDHAKASLIIHQAQTWINVELNEFKNTLTAVSYLDGVLLIQADNSISAQECRNSLEFLMTFLKEEKKQHITDVRIVRSC